MKRNIFQFIINTIFLFCLCSCNNCIQHEITNLTFTAKDLSVNPYTGNEILTFKKLNGGSFVLSKGSRGKERNTIHQIENQDAKEYHHGCQGDYFTEESNWLVFETNPNDSITLVQINLDFTYTFQNPTYDKQIRLFFYHGNNNSGFDGRFKFSNDSIFDFPDKTDSIVNYYTSINIGPKSFSNVYELYCPNGDTRNDEWFSTAYYSVTEGFCGVKSNFGELWYLDK